MILLNELNDVLSTITLKREAQERIVWKFDKIGVFSVKSFVYSAMQNMASQELTSYSFAKKVWTVQ